MSTLQKPPTPAEIKAYHVANFRTFKRLQTENPFAAARLLEDVDAASIEAGGLAEENPELPPEAA
jgi:hypothetical protein